MVRVAASFIMIISNHFRIIILNSIKIIVVDFIGFADITKILRKIMD